jgi:hypothetical protein
VKIKALEFVLGDEKFEPDSQFHVTVEDLLFESYSDIDDYISKVSLKK